MSEHFYIQFQTKEKSQEKTILYKVSYAYENGYLEKDIVIKLIRIVTISNIVHYKNLFWNNFTDTFTMILN